MVKYVIKKKEEDGQVWIYVEPKSFFVRLFLSMVSFFLVNDVEMGYYPFFVSDSEDNAIRRARRKVEELNGRLFVYKINYLGEVK